MLTPNDSVLGILYFGNIYESLPPFFGLEDHHFQQLARLGPNYGIRVVIFSTQGTDLSNKTIKGFQLSSQQEWVLTDAHLPQVIYVRGISANPSENKERYLLVEILEHMNIALINNNAFSELVGDKLAFHQFLRTTSLSPYLPATEEFTPGKLSSFCQQYPVTFLKPIDGFESRGLIRIETRLGKLQVDFSDDQGSLQHLQGSFAQLLPKILEFIRTRAYIMQEGVPRKHIQNRLVEHRCLFQRVGSQWYQTTHVLRVNSAQTLPFITAGREKNYLYEEAPFPLEVLDPEGFQRDIDQLGQQLCLLLNHSNRHASEFSMDFIVGNDDSIKILECNSRPSGFFLQTGHWQGRMLYLSRTLEQSRFLIHQFPIGIPN